MPVFPSLEWFQALRAIVNNDPDFRKFGTIDCDMGIEIGDTTYRVTFEAFEVTGVAAFETADPEATDSEAPDPEATDLHPELDFVLSMSPDRWREMIENINENGAAGLHYTLNTLDMEDPDNFARSPDYHRRDKFYRFNQTLQDFFDASARIDTTFPH